MKEWPKASPQLVDDFRRTAARIAGVEVRQMFGFPAAFVRGNMAFAMYGDSIMLRLPADDRESLLASGWSQFEPTPGRRMREYLAMPADVAAAPDHKARWLRRAAEHTATLPPRQPKQRTRKR